MVLIGYAAAMAYLFMRISRCGDYFGYILAHLRVPLLLLAVAMVACIASGRFMNVVLSKMGMRFVALTFVFLLSSAFSVWPGGSVNEFRTFWPPSLFVFIVVASFLTTVKGLRTALAMLGYGVGIAAVYAMLVGSVNSVGRFDAAGGMAYSNTNDLALVMVMGMPALMFLFMDSTRGILQRLAALGMLMAAFLLMLSTGSRGGLLGFFAVCAFLLYHQSWAVRLRAFAGLAVLVLIGFASAPDAMLRRLTTFMSSQQPQGADPISDANYGPDPGDDYTGIAAASAEGRWYLVKQAAELLVRNPVLGVGFGMFMVGQNELALDQGASRGSWKGAHNMYLQVGSENGFPGLYLFVMIIYASWKTFRFHRRPPPNATPRQRHLAHIAFAMSASMVGFLVSGTFLTVAYDYFISMFAAIAMGFDNVAALEAQRVAGEGDPADTGDPTAGARGQIDWTQAPAGAPAPAQLRHGL